MRMEQSYQNTKQDMGLRLGGKDQLMKASPKRERGREGYDSVFDGSMNDVTIKLMPF